MKLRSAFIKATTALVGGTAAAQIITVAALPVLTRLYPPEDFELLAVYLAALGILSSVACLRYEIAIPLPEKASEGVELLALALLSASCIGLATLTICLLWPHWIASTLGVPRFANYLFLLPLGITMIGFYAGLQYWATRMGRFGLVARSRLVQASVGVGAQVGVGALGLTPFGLLFGHMLYGGAGAIRLAISTWRHDSEDIRSLNWKRLRATAVAYRRYPTYSTVEALSNSAAVQLPVILIAAFAVGPEAGFVLLASRALGAPMQIVGAAISQVYLAQAPAEHRAGRLRTFTLNILGRLALFGIPSLVILALVAPNLFELLFGAEWRRAGTLLQWMTPWFIFQLLSAPVSTVFHVTGYQRTATILQISGLCLRAGMVLVACYWYNNYIAEAYALSGAIFYAIYGIAIFCILPRNNRKNAW